MCCEEKRQTKTSCMEAREDEHRPHDSSLEDQNATG